MIVHYHPPGPVFFHGENGELIGEYNGITKAVNLKCIKVDTISTISLQDKAIVVFCCYYLSWSEGFPELSIWISPIEELLLHWPRN